MSGLSFIALILLSLLAYSGGAVGKAGKSLDIKPQIIDLFFVLIIWAGAIYSRLTFRFNKWLLILIWAVLGAIIGILSAWPRKARGNKPKITSKETSPNLLKHIWQSWKAFSLRLGSFQSRVWLSLFFFIFVSPAAVLVRLFSDPLGIKKCGKVSHWLPKKEIGADLEQYRRQF